MPGGEVIAPVEFQYTMAAIARLECQMREIVRRLCPRSAIRPCLKSADHLCQRVALLAFVQAGLAKLSELRRFQPIQLACSAVRSVRPSSCSARSS